MIGERLEVHIPFPELRGASLALGACRDIEVCLDGPAGTGKTVGALCKIHTLLTKYAEAKAFVGRKTSTALAGSAVATFQTHILDPREGVNYFGGSKARPAAFEYPNGSRMVLNGLDKREKIKSWEFDIALINEATECEEEDIEYVRMRLRNGKLPYHQLIMDVNPAYPTHWLNQRMNRGVTTRLLSRHEDNPRYYDIVKQEWTEAGRDYIFGTLEGLTGVLRDRYRYGKWVAAEGTIYQDSWDAKRNIISHFEIPREWPRYLSIDFGFNNPFVCLWIARDPDGRLYVYRQIYKTKTLVEDHAEEIKRLSRWNDTKGDPLPRSILCDHDAEDRATLERYLGMVTYPAHKSVSDGIQAVSSYLRASGDGKPRIYILNNSLINKDHELEHSKKPTCLQEEFDCYVWDTRQGLKFGDQPVKENDHAQDALRYAVASFALAPTTVRRSHRWY